jgi:hypothetical protein
MIEPKHISRFFGGATVLAITIFGLATGAQAQVTDAQRSAIRSSCRSDFMSNCASVTPGGAEAFQCLKRNESKLSAACQSAVNAISAAEKPAAAAPAQAAAPAEEKPAVVKPAAAPSPEKPAATKPTAKPASASAPPASTQQPAKKQAATPPKAKTAAVPPAPVDAGPPPPPPPPNWAQIPPRFELQVVRSCRPEVRTICALPAGGGRILNCLAANEQTVSPSCQAALARARAAAVQ